MKAAKASAPTTAAAPPPVLTMVTVPALAGAAAVELKLVPTIAFEHAFSPSRTRTSAAVLIRGILAAGALQAIAHRSPFQRLGGRLDQDFVAARGVELAQRGVELLGVRMRIARHAQPVVDALVRSRKSEHRHFFLEARDLLVEVVGRHEPRRRARCVVALEPARVTRRCSAFLQHRASESLFKVLLGNAAWTKQRGRGAGEIHDG